jgi:Domain of unknown function (DUF1707)/Domain of unknown function (DUF4190)
MTARSGDAGGAGYGIPAWRDARSQGYLLASTADREAAVDVLKAGYAEGRLTKDEYDARAGEALAARTLGDLARLTADLPAGHPAPPAWLPGPARTNSLAAGALLCGLGQMCFGPLATVPAIALGHMARREIRRTGELGMGLATVGLVLGWAGAALFILTALLIVAAVAILRPGG